MVADSAGWDVCLPGIEVIECGPMEAFAMPLGRMPQIHSTFSSRARIVLHEGDSLTFLKTMESNVRNAPCDAGVHRNWDKLDGTSPNYFFLFIYKIFSELESISENIIKGLERRTFSF